MVIAQPWGVSTERVAGSRLPARATCLDFRPTTLARLKAQEGLAVEALEEVDDVAHVGG